LPNWHIEAVAFHLELVRLGQIKRLIINMPPRSLKSIMTSVAFPAYALGLDPATGLIVVSYGAELAVKLANDFRAVVSSTWYRNLFPAMCISQVKNTAFEVCTTRGGFRLSTSIDGTLTGRGGDIIIIDDPLKPIDALSDPKRDHVNQWYKHSLYSRLDDKQSGAIVVVMQRLHIDDLTGSLLGSPGEWVHLNLPAIAAQDEQIQIGPDQYHLRRAGDPLDLKREPIALLEELREQLGADTFAAQYQQSPIPLDGAMIKRSWIPRFDQLPVRPTSSCVVQSWDTASKGGAENDWSACATVVLHDKKYYLHHMLRRRLDYPELVDCALTHARAHGPGKILIEDAGIGTALLRELQKAGFTTVAIKPEGDKITRVAIQSAKFRSGQVLFPKQAPWLCELEAEVFAFPNTKHDDQVDSIVQALAYSVPSFPWTDQNLGGLKTFNTALWWSRRFPW
jgi:predicted phage terminase large subunit-like protein